MTTDGLRGRVQFYGWVLLLVFLLLSGCSTVHDAPPAPTSSASAPTTTPLALAVSGDIGFANQRKWEEHFHKHGAEFGALNADQYLRLAQELRDKPVSDDILEAVRPDGTFSRFERSSGSFLACDRDRTLRTFFKPHDGELYFRRQVKRPHD